MVILQKYIPAWNMADVSPFCVKVETYLRMVEVPFETRTSDVCEAPKGKLPYIDDNGAIVSDSSDIIRYFEAKLPNALDRDLTPHERALSTAFRGLLDEEAHFYGMVLRWKMDGGWQIYRPAMRKYVSTIGVPLLLTPILAAFVRRKIANSCVAQGSGRHTREEVEARLLEVAQASVIQLGEGPYFLGPQPHVIDAIVFSYLSAALDAPFPFWSAAPEASSLGPGAV